jgi:hypothetical protein
LIFCVRRALAGETTPRAARFAAERCRFVSRDAHGAPALLHNALKTMAEAWPEEPALSEPIARLLNLCEANPIKVAPRRRASSTGGPATPWWVA